MQVWASLRKSQSPSGPKVTYDKHVKPILREHCFSCHNQEQKKGGLALDSYARGDDRRLRRRSGAGRRYESSRLYRAGFAQRRAQDAAHAG